VGKSAPLAGQKAKTNTAQSKNTTKKKTAKSQGSKKSRTKKD
jgi:hypothetical protein